MKEKIFMKHLRTEMKKHIEIPCHKRENHESESAEIGLYIICNSVPQRVIVRVLGHPAGYVLSSYIVTKDGNINKLISQTKLNYFNCTEDNNEVYVGIRDHIVGLLRRSDLNTVLSRYYGMLSSKFIAKPLDDYIIAILQNNSMYDFIYVYDRLVYDLVTTINSRTRNVIDSIELDNKPINDIFTECSTTQKQKEEQLVKTFTFKEFNDICKFNDIREFSKTYPKFRLLPPSMYSRGYHEFDPISLNPYPNNIKLILNDDSTVSVDKISILQNFIEKTRNSNPVADCTVLVRNKSFRNLWGLLS